MLELSYFPAKYAGITCEAAFYDYDSWLDACCKTVQDFEPDLVQIIPFFPGAVYELLGAKQLRLPGHGVPSNHTHQFIEGEFLKADEYDAFMEDRSDFILRSYLPRIFGVLEPLSKLPPFWQTTFSYAEVPLLAESLASPEIYNALETLLKAGREMSRWHSKRAAFGEKIEELGFPLHGTRGAHIPFEFLSYHVRGMRGMYLDMYRQPDKLIEVFDSLLPIARTG